MDQFKLGMHVGEIKAWCEAAKNEAKLMSLSAPFNSEEYDELHPYMKEHATRNDVNFFLERELIQTDLFGDMDLYGIWVFIIYKHPETLEKYMKLKQDKAEIIKKAQYKGEKRREIAIRFGKLLGYNEKSIVKR
jgi:hypothetical protein